MKDLKDLGNLTIREIFENALGEDKAEEFFELLNQAINDGLRGDELKDYIYKILCKLSVTEINVFQVSSMLPQVIQGHK